MTAAEEVGQQTQTIGRANDVSNVHRPLESEREREREGKEGSRKVRCGGKYRHGILLAVGARNLICTVPY